MSNRYIHNPIKRICRKCGQEALHYKTSYACISCHNKYTIAHNLKNKEKHVKASQKSRYKNRYGITLDDYDKILADQEGLCANNYCKSAIKLTVDHCHDTGIIRGILCTTCNLALGQVDDSKRRLRGLIEYLEDFDKRLEEIQEKYELNMELPTSSPL